MSLPYKKEYLGRIHGRYQRAGREHKGKILDDFYAVCGYHRKFALRLFHRRLNSRRRKSGPKRKYDPTKLLPMLKPIWLAAEQPCCKLLKVLLPVWTGFIPEMDPALKKELLAMSAASLYKGVVKGWVLTFDTFAGLICGTVHDPNDSSQVKRLNRSAEHFPAGSSCGLLQTWKISPAPGSEIFSSHRAASAWQALFLLFRAHYP